ncbi:MAG TPA: DEAD/DEAH box helicase [Conexibacter sp.]|jgi:ATP-dependent Lhr-like helicase|nr:DEAD/DEAH box helicase [Conexibacter sp.]
MAPSSTASSPLDAFAPRTREWFMRAFDAPTEAQAQAWPAIATGEHVLISAPTGSGKTLAAFLWALDRLAADKNGLSPSGDRNRPPAGDVTTRRTRLVYVSPLKALSYDIERNLRAPLQGIGADLRVAIRTGDTSQRERAQMLREPPDVLITTPESLYLMLTSRAREILRGAEWAIVDEIHAVAGTKRGAHLALTLERLDALAQEQNGGREVQRIGLSATQNPLEEVGRFMVGPRRRCRIVDTGVRKPLDLKIHVPVESMVEPDATPAPDLDPLNGGTEATRRSIWPAIYPELLKLIQQHRSTILFVNNRRSAERIALRLNELANEPRDEAAAADEGDGAAGESGPPVEIARAHHGSLAREERLVVEELLKAGEIPCIVATSSLELGIDMGAVDLVLQVESPKSVAAGLQRIGRAGHNVGDTSKGRIFPKFRADLLECAVVARRMRDGAIEPTVVPRNPLDVLAQQIVAIAAATTDDEPINVDDLHALVTRTYTYAELSRTQLENVLDMLDGRYPSSEFAELRPRIVWDRVAGTIRPRRGARALAVTNAGTIPDRGLFMVTLPDGRRVGELDEEMVYEARPGQTFLLGASSWRIEEIGRDRVVVTPAPGAPGAIPFWKGDSVGRPKELGEAIGRFSRWAVDQSAETLAADYDLDDLAARNLLDFLREQQQATRVIPSDKTIVIERFRDEIGDWRLCVLSPYGGRIHAAWGLALSARIRDQLGLEADAIWSDDGIIVHLPDADEAPGADIALIEPDELEDMVVAELSGSALFGARFRENAGRSLLIPRAYPGKRTPLWQQRLKSQTLLEVAKRYGEFPIILETYRECLRDVLDLPGLRDLLTQLHRREISVVEVETPTASPFASSLLFDYVATYMYEGDTPNAERRAAALSLDRDLLRELLGQEELRDLIDADALEQVEDDLQHRSDRTRAATRDELHDVLRRVGDLTSAEAAQRVHAGIDVDVLLAELERERRALLLRIGGELRWVDAADAGLYRDALGVVPPGGLPEAFLADVPDALVKLIRRYAQTHGPFQTSEPRERFGLDPAPALTELERAGELVRGELRPGGSGREWCDADVLRRLRRASLAVLRKEIEPADQRALAAFLPSWQGVDKHPAGGAGVDRLREQLVPLQGLALTPETWEREVLPRRVGAYSATWMDALCASGELVWVGAGALGRTNGRVALYFREDAGLIGPPPLRGDVPSEPSHEAVRERLAAGSCFFTDLLIDVDLPPEELQEALWDLAWAGAVTNDAFAPLRAPRLTLARAQRAASRTAGRAGRRFSSRRGGAQAQVQGRWSLTERLFEVPAQPVDPSARRRVLAELLLERYGILTRELVLAEGVPGGFSAIYPELSQLETLGVARRGYFVEGLGGAQFALPGAVERLRAQKAPEEAPPLVLAATDPAQPYGAALPWPKRDGESAGAGRRPSRTPGALVVLAGSEPVLYLERGGRALQSLVAPDDARIPAALEALADHARAGRIRRIALEKVDGESVMGTPWEAALAEVGFRAGPRRLTLSA